MRACRHCSHQNADHLAFCSQCGRRLVSGAMFTLDASGHAPSGSGHGAARVGTAPTWAPGGTAYPTAATQAFPKSGRLAAARRRSRLGWVGESIGYVYVFFRGKLDAEERRRRLTEERTGAEALLSGAVSELGAAVLQHGVTHPDLTGLLEAIGRANAKREAAVADGASADSLQQAEATRLATEEAAAQAEWSTSDKASRDADELLRATTTDRRSVEAKLGRARDERARLQRAASGNPPPTPSRAGELAHEAARVASEQQALEAQAARLDRELVDHRAKAASLSATTAKAKTKLESAVGARRRAASAMAASIAGRQRDRGEAEREVSELTAELGRAAATARPPHPALLAGYQTFDRLKQTIAERDGQLSALAQASGHYDGRKLLAGVGLLASGLVAIGAALWAVLR